MDSRRQIPHTGLYGAPVISLAIEGLHPRLHPCGERLGRPAMLEDGALACKPLRHVELLPEQVLERGQRGIVHQPRQRQVCWNPAGQGEVPACAR